MTRFRRPLPIIAVTSGEPGGIGPELVARLFGRWRPSHSMALVIGAPALFERWRRRFRFAAPVVASFEEALALQDGARPARVVVLDTGVEADYPVGSDSVGGGLHAGTAIVRALELARNHSVGAIVTPPASKKSLNLGGFHYPGHTEMLAQYLNAPDCQMMMARRDLRVVPFTRHVPLARVAPDLRPDRLETCLRVTADALKRDFKIPRPRIAVAGLNPHAGEDGVIGVEDREIIAPVVAKLRAQGMDVSGPHPADAMFQSAPLAVRAPDRTSGRAIPRRKLPYPDAYVTMYHDQGLVPYKMLAQKQGVNVTIGLPTPRTSVDHGTAYDIAGRGVAEDGSLLEAYRLAEFLADRRSGKKS
ncbi:MAG TPA: 4-hydroxythreonine-4-phosphate dehydrogenase PdxA [Candidatus Krumholzibacteria bacterium]|nr:4-hydroxythreonine-4-phosphate dehydrogenase PdxA [Candidatus Krumholzibacteria bacterium]